MLAALALAAALHPATAATLDPTFGTAGILRRPSPYDPRVTIAAQGARLGILGNGGLVYQSSQFSWQSPMQLQRLDVNGQPFGTALSWPDVVNVPGVPMLRQQDGRTLVGAMRGWDAAVIRLDAGGDPDPAFGNTGVASIPRTVTPVLVPGGGEMVAALATDLQGRILVAVASYSYVNVEPDALAVVRLNANGQVESRFQNPPLPAGHDANGFNTRLTPLYGGELRLDVGSYTWYYSADGQLQSAPTWRKSIFSYPACLCDGMVGWSLVGTLPSGDQLYAGIPSVMAISLDSVTPTGRAGSVSVGLEWTGRGETPQTLLARIHGNGKRFDVVAQTPQGTTILMTTSTASSVPLPLPPMLVLPDIASRLQILDIGEQPDGSLIVTTQPSGSTATDTGYAAFRIRPTGLPGSGFVTVETPGLLLASANSGAPASGSTSTGTTTGASTSGAASAGADRGGGGATGVDLLALLAGLLLVSASSSRRSPRRSSCPSSCGAGTRWRRARP